MVRLPRPYIRLLIVEQAPNLIVKPALMALAIRYCHTQSAPVLFDLKLNLKPWSDDMGELIRIAASMVRELKDSQKRRAVAFKTVLSQ